MLNLVLVVVTTFVERSKEDYPKNYSRLIGITSFLAWFQLLYYARGFSSMAALVQMIFAVMSDMSAFFVLMCISIVGLAHSLAVSELVGEHLNAAETREHFMNFVRDIALMSVLGEFEYSDYNTAFKAALALVVIVVMSIVMLNLLIAIISETYERVRGLQASTINKARADLVDEMERTFLKWIPSVAPARITAWLSKLMTPSYLIVLSPDATRQNASESMTEVGKLRKQVMEQSKQLAAMKRHAENQTIAQEQATEEIKKLIIAMFERHTVASSTRTST